MAIPNYNPSANSGDHQTNANDTSAAHIAGFRRKQYRSSRNNDRRRTSGRCRYGFLVDDVLGLAYVPGIVHGEGVLGAVQFVADRSRVFKIGIGRIEGQPTYGHLAVCVRFPVEYFFPSSVLHLYGCAGEGLALLIDLLERDAGLDLLVADGGAAADNASI